MADPEQYSSCEICPIIENPPQQEIDYRLIEGDHWRVTLREDQALLGTAYVTLKEHVGGYEEQTDEQHSELLVVHRSLVKAVGAAFQPDITNLSFLMNHAFRPTDDPNFTPQPHLHGHFKPRYQKPRIVGGETFIDPEFGSYLRRGRSQIVAPHLGAIIADRIRSYL